MANVLGTLFGDIADAIRDKTGETGTMKPAEFPGKISAITAGGAAFTYKKIGLSPTEGYITVTHNLGMIPDVAILCAAHASVDGYINFAIGFSQSMLAALGGGWIGYVQRLANGSAVSASQNWGIENEGNNPAYGYIRNATATTLEVGGRDWPLYTQSMGGYDLIVISGIS